MHKPAFYTVCHSELPSFIKIQQDFTQHIRNPEQAIQLDGIEDRRMKIYRELFYNNIEGFLSSGFPVIRDIYSEKNWHKMVRDFFIKHKCKSPYFLKIVEEFIDYLQNDRETHKEDPAGLFELAHYEWVELALSISDEKINYEQIDVNGDLLKSHPVLSPLALPLSYQFPVHKMSKNYLPDKITNKNTDLVVYRDYSDDVKFMEINDVTAYMLIQFRDHPEKTGNQVLLDIAKSLNTSNVDVILNAGLESLQQLKRRGIIPGTRKNN